MSVKQGYLPDLSVDCRMPGLAQPKLEKYRVNLLRSTWVELRLKKTHNSKR